MELFSLESQMSWEKKRTIVSGTPWCYLVSVHCCLFISHAFPFSFWDLSILLQPLIAYLLSFPKQSIFVSNVKYLYLTLLFWTNMKEEVWMFFSSLRYFKIAIKTPTRTLLCSIGNKPIILCLPYNWIIEAWCHFGFHAVQPLKGNFIIS